MVEVVVGTCGRGGGGVSEAGKGAVEPLVKCVHTIGVREKGSEL